VIDLKNISIVLRRLTFLVMLIKYIYIYIYIYI